MLAEWPKIISRRSTRVSPWVAIIERAVKFAPGAEVELYHAIDQQDYIAIVAALADGRIAIVRQYRPALENFTWELPAGLVDAGENPAVSCQRELLEETGLTAQSVHALGSFAPCTARLSNRLHSFFVEARLTGEAATERGIELQLVTPAQLAKMIVTGEFTLQLHVGALLLAGLHGHIDLGTLQAAPP